MGGSFTTLMCLLRRLRAERVSQGLITSNPITIISSVELSSLSKQPAKNSLIYYKTLNLMKIKNNPRNLTTISYIYFRPPRET